MELYFYSISHRSKSKIHNSDPNPDSDLNSESGFDLTHVTSYSVKSFILSSEDFIRDIFDKYSVKDELSTIDLENFTYDLEESLKNMILDYPLAENQDMFINLKNIIFGNPTNHYEYNFILNRIKDGIKRREEIDTIYSYVEDLEDICYEEEKNNNIINRADFYELINKINEYKIIVSNFLDVSLFYKEPGTDKIIDKQLYEHLHDFIHCLKKNIKEQNIAKWSLY